MFKFFYRRKDGINDATAFYVGIIKKAILKGGEQFEEVVGSPVIDNDENVVTIGSLDAFFTYRQKYKYLINWYQGIGPEQLLYFSKENKLYVWAKVILYHICEKIALRKCKLNLFVSKSMLAHYKHKYGYKGDNYYIMPCFNEYLQDLSFYNEKYTKPTFVYTGSADGWQCIPKTLCLFKRIKEQIPDAALTIYSKDKEAVQKMLMEYAVEADIKYVNYALLSEEIRKFKYGFLIRQKNPVNDVATPTKMCSYMANGLIPIYSDVIGDFKDVFSGMNYTIPLSEDFEGIDKVFELEKKKINASEVYKEFSEIFRTYYSEEKYINSLYEKMKELNLL